MARGAVRGALRDWDLEGLADSVELIVTELAANAVLHTSGDFEVWVERLEHGGRRDRGVRVGVADTSPELPVVPSPSVSSMTGRGLLLVRSLAARLGFEPTLGGKRVWADVRDDRLPGDAGLGELIEQWADDLADRPRSGTRTYRVELGEVPTDLLLAAKAHVENLVREFLLAAAGAHEGSTGAVPPHLAELIETVVNRFSGPRLSIKRQALEAARRGEDHVRLCLDLDPDADDAGEAYLAALDEADLYCRAARVLTLESPPKHRVFRQWYVGEIVRQLRDIRAGRTPLPPQPFERRLLEEIDAVAAAWATADRAARLYSVSSALAGALTPAAVAQAALSEGVAALGASGGGLLLPAGADRVEVPGTVGYKPHLVDSLRSESSAAELPAAVSLRTGEAVWMETREERDSRFRDLVEIEAEAASMCAVPLMVGDRVLGALRFSFSDPRLFDEDERRFVTALAALTAQALDRAQLHQSRSELYHRLQRSLLPPRLPEIPGLDLAAVYHPLGDGIEIGGDFYDVWSIGDHEWAFALGDVCGTGPEAAAISAFVRYTLRAITTPDPDPVTLLGRLNEVLLAGANGEQERFATVIFGRVRATERGFSVRIGTGGHPEPLLQRADGTVSVLPTGGSLLGILPTVRIVSREIELTPGDRLILYSDGASEARQGGRMLGTEGLVELALSGPDGGSAAAKWIEAQVLQFSGGRLHDDMAVLVLQAETAEEEEPFQPAARGAMSSTRLK